MKRNYRHQHKAKNDYYDILTVAIAAQTYCKNTYICRNVNVYDTDGCTQNNNQGCEFNCVNNFDDTYTCECGDTEVLAADQKSCEGQ